MGWIIFLSSLIPVHFLLKGHDKLRTKLERCLHATEAGLLQSTILQSVGCIWFNCSEAKDREIVARKRNFRTCVNNHYTVMLKKGAFELGCTVCPIAIKYNKIFVDVFWNSRKQSFTMHLLQLMTSWAVVCDVWYLEPQNLKLGETPIEFAERVRDIISAPASLKKVPWDGYLKYSRPSPKHREGKQQSFAESVLRFGTYVASCHNLLGVTSTEAHCLMEMHLVCRFSLTGRCRWGLGTLLPLPNSTVYVIAAQSSSEHKSERLPHPYLHRTFQILGRT
ncbi:hypothetical protein F0562_028414 [Nyssa sinensis]|uniref:Uncharacterized protein n=1 Tax=Nyssa sinensis TaxID=561372 RepID=A0A5J5B162_9ASTE|nr:hypothetical protein F0562_028414 [Nyssa sinensis]